MTSDLHSFYFNKNESNKSCLMALKTIILEQEDNITENTKYG